MNSPKRISPDIAALRKEALAWVEQHGPSGLFGPFPNRSCWNCNAAHEHLKRADYPIECFACGHFYFRGVDLTEIPTVSPSHPGAV